MTAISRTSSDGLPAPRRGLTFALSAALPRRGQKLEEISVNAAAMHRPSTHEQQAPADDGLSLGALLGLLAVPGDATGVPSSSATAVRQAVALRGAELRVQMREWSERAAAWGSGPQGAWRAW
jgi:hypothetical protein